MNREEFHLFDATVDLLDSSEINSDSRNSDVKQLVLRVVLVVRVYFPRAPPSVAAGLVWRQRRRFHLSLGRRPRLEMNAAPLALSSHRIRFFCARLRSYDGVDF
jgi:hypothetical protein